MEDLPHLPWPMEEIEPVDKVRRRPGERSSSSGVAGLTCRFWARGRKEEGGSEHKSNTLSLSHRDYGESVKV